MGIVIPPRDEASFGRRPARLSPLVKAATDSVVLETAAIGAVPLNELSKPAGELRGARAAVQEALDTLFGAD